MHTRHVAQLIFASFASTLIFAAGPAAACKYGTCWNAVAVGSDGAAGYAADQATAPRAHKRAARGCGAKCTAVEVFDGGCGALATSRSGTAHLGLGPSRNKARTNAMEECSSLGAFCTFRVGICSR
ncbi:hypothetical protein RA2_00965 [Roseovarius sp. A-2]|uniref:DUF4189 domain-containing protein n=1 Tax=Roseovarius sp. A-2 TaxID=1570360 RepID=UPI0009B566BD|nr:DUF4189 domain-containing protein [Roseovarius sp. A-2]GAW33920.1 hypothetical protein RA2_00965 [Roseovarius sp. A-2]